MSRRKAGTLVALAVLLLAVVLAQVVRSGVNEIRSAAPAQRLAGVLPLAITGVEVRDIAIASTTEMKRAVSELLNYDDAVCRVYESQGVRITVYVAAWAPGKMSPRLVAGHTPDVCWPAAGWERRSREEPALSRVDELCAAAGFVPGAYRVFTQGGEREYVLYWHSVGNDFQSYGRTGGPPWWAFAAEVWHFGVVGSPREQRFYRISSNQPLESVWARPAFTSLRAALDKLGLAARG